jgi:hypothetical protein
LFGFGLLADGGGGGVIVLFCVGVALLSGPVRGFELFKGVLVVIFPGRLGVPFVIAGEPIFGFVVPPLYIGVSGGKENNVVGPYAGGGGGLNLFILSVLTGATWPDRPSYQHQQEQNLLLQINYLLICDEKKK